MAYDNCDDSVAVAPVEISTIAGSCDQSYTIVRTFRAFDNCENEAAVTQYIYVVDESAPQFEEQPNEYTYECSETVVVIQPIAFDNCDSELSYIYVDDTSGNSCHEIINRIWTVTDECDNSSYFTQTIHIVDTTAPVIIGNIEIELPCEDFDPNSGIYVSAQDECNDYYINIVNTMLLSGECAGDYMRTYVAIDSCGNQSDDFIQFIHLLDNEAPTASEPVDITISCGQNIPAFEPSFLDNCGSELVVSHTLPTIVGYCNDTYTESWTAVDPCGNSTTVERFVTVVDTIDPIFTYVPEDMYVSCDQEYDEGELPIAQDNCDEEVAISVSQNTVQGNCPSNFQIVYSFTATDNCGNTATASRTIQVYDNQGVIWAQDQPTSYTYECGSAAPVITPQGFDNCSSFETSYTDSAVWSEGCISGFTRTWTALDACDNQSAPFHQFITFEDTTEPQLIGCPSNLELPCDQDAPTAASVTATDNCDEDVEVIFEEYVLGTAPAPGSIADCAIQTPVRPVPNICGYSYDWAMALFNMPVNHRYYQVTEGNFVQYPDGSIHVVATMVNATNAANGWNVEMSFNNGMDWASWSSQDFPTSFKADCAAEAANHTDWMYFILQAGEGAELTGFGAYAGSSLNVTHAPVNNYFGFQLGNGANNYNGADNGFGGWFNYTGLFRSNYEDQLSSVNGSGDLAFELDCCPNHSLVRQWTATDCSGNSSVCSQTISWNASAPTSDNSDGSVEQFTNALETGRVASITAQPNPANNNTLFTFRAAYTGKTSVEIYDLTGKKVADVFVGTTEAGSEYRVDFNVSNLATGVYSYRLTNGSEVKIDRLIISK
jgi:hypothetical protein